MATDRTPSSHRREPSLHPSPAVSHRSSFAENLRGNPRRMPSFTGGLNDLLMYPPTKDGAESRFRGRDWRSVQVSEIIDTADARFVELDTSIEETTKLLIRSGSPNVVLVRESHKTKTCIDTFDYSDLNAYLLLVLGLSSPPESQDMVRRARGGEAIPLRDLLHHLGPREPPIAMPRTADLTRAMEVLGSGMHRVVITKEGTSEAVGVLSQLRLVRFFWDNDQNFAATSDLYARSLKELQLGTKDVMSIGGDRPLSDALLLMHEQGITSLPVLDAQRNVVGNVSHVDVRLLTDTSSIPLLSSSCLHFISVILSERGLEDGKDSYPVFYVTPLSTLAQTVAKLCATRSHRMWIVDQQASPSGSVPPSPGIVASSGPPGTPMARRASHDIGSTAPPTIIPGASLSGRLSGVVSLTDILNLFARASGLSPCDPDEIRKRRRRSSSSSQRPNLDSVRASMERPRGDSSAGRSSRSTSSNRVVA
ncbi:hypothetical protein K470DRAFT_249012 [Piedraia hortae CBS 480.64]|uniref:CBS domain-containing protein n=1 Tax=Piedraia hortae CBS 480.64 TaxID=1314780 RepID=A0A6A7BWF1_9PEZI|nr:hypothetical protein K470DRAFT_249012 [Piedraia hortae CBS 480.64]